MTRELDTFTVIRTNMKRVGDGTEGDPYHRHTQYWNMDGALLVEFCDMPSSPCEGFPRRGAYND